MSRKKQKKFSLFKVAHKPEQEKKHMFADILVVLAFLVCSLLVVVHFFWGDPIRMYPYHAWIPVTNVEGEGGRGPVKLKTFYSGFNLLPDLTQLPQVELLLLPLPKDEVVERKHQPVEEVRDDTERKYTVKEPWTFRVSTTTISERFHRVLEKTNLSLVDGIITIQGPDELTRRYSHFFQEIELKFSGLDQDKKSVEAELGRKIEHEPFAMHILFYCMALDSEEYYCPENQAEKEQLVRAAHWFQVPTLLRIYGHLPVLSTKDYFLRMDEAHFYHKEMGIGHPWIEPEAVALPPRYTPTDLKLDIRSDPSSLDDENSLFFIRLIRHLNEFHDFIPFGSFARAIRDDDFLNQTTAKLAFCSGSLDLGDIVDACICLVPSLKISHVDCMNGKDLDQDYCLLVENSTEMYLLYFYSCFPTGKEDLDSKQIHVLCRQKNNADAILWDSKRNATLALPRFC